MDSKEHIRKRILAKRRGLAPDLMAGHSARIVRRLTHLTVFRQARSVMTYVSKDNEVDTHRLIRCMLSRGKRVSVPCTNPSEKRIVPCLIRDFDELEPSTFGILEPKKGRIRPADPRELEVVLVPGIAFSPKGFRIGFGSGYFDRFLPQTGAYRIGLAFDFQVVDSVPLGEQDQPVHCVVTDQRVLRMLISP